MPQGSSQRPRRSIFKSEKDVVSEHVGSPVKGIGGKVWRIGSGDLSLNAHLSASQKPDPPLVPGATVGGGPDVGGPEVAGGPAEPASEPEYSSRRWA